MDAPIPLPEQKHQVMANIDNSAVTHKRAASPSTTQPQIKHNRTTRGVSTLRLPTTVVAMYFAVGTTEEDLRQVMIPDNHHHDSMLSCQIISTGPIVMAKLVYQNHATAARIVESWNGSISDGKEIKAWITDDRSIPLPQTASKSKTPAPTTANGSLFGHAPVFAPPPITKAPFSNFLASTPIIMPAPATIGVSSVAPAVRTSTSFAGNQNTPDSSSACVPFEADPGKATIVRLPTALVPNVSFGGFGGRGGLGGFGGFGASATGSSGPVWGIPGRAGTPRDTKNDMAGSGSSFGQ